MSTTRKRYAAEFKAKLALEVIKGERTLAEIASDAQIHPNLLMQWRRQLLDGLPAAFADKRVKDDREREEREARLYQQIGQLKVELDWLKKKSGRLS